MSTTNTTDTASIPTAAVRHARNADASWATADALYTLAKRAEELAAPENGAGPLSDEARRLFSTAVQHARYADDEDQRAFALGYHPLLATRADTGEDDLWGEA